MYPCPGMRARPAAGGCGRFLRTQGPAGDGRERAEHGRGPPGGAPVAERAQEEDDQTGQGDPGADASEGPAGRVGGVLPEVAEEGVDRDDEDQGAGDPGEQPERKPRAGAVDGGHPRQSGGQYHQGDAKEQTGADRRRDEDARRHADQTADIVGGGQVRTGTRGQPRLRVHQRQDRGVDEAADAHACRQCRGGLAAWPPGRAASAACGADERTTGPGPANSCGYPSDAVQTLVDEDLGAAATGDGEGPGTGAGHCAAPTVPGSLG